MVAQLANDILELGCNSLVMGKKPRQTAGQLTQIYAGRQPRRPHYLKKLMENRRIDRGDLIEELDVDKSLVARWLDEERPTTPGAEWAYKLGVFFGDEENPVDIFKDPDDVWASQFFAGRDREEVDRIKQTMETGWPKKAKG